MARVTDEEVRTVIDLGSSIETEGPIRTANTLTNKITARDTNSLLSTADLKEIELYLAAHFAALKDPQYQQNKTEEASATYQGQTGQGLEGTWWGQQAIMLDETGFLRTMQDGPTHVGAFWLGLPPSEQTDYEDRD